MRGLCVSRRGLCLNGFGLSLFGFGRLPQCYQQHILRDGDSVARLVSAIADLPAAKRRALRGGEAALWQDVLALILDAGAFHLAIAAVLVEQYRPADRLLLTLGFDFGVLRHGFSFCGCFHLSRLFRRFVCLRFGYFGFGGLRFSLLSFGLLGFGGLRFGLLGFHFRRRLDLGHCPLGHDEHISGHSDGVAGL